jgi:hypothetical protein
MRSLCKHARHEPKSREATDRPDRRKTDDFRRPAIRLSKNSMICRLWRNADARPDGKMSKLNAEKFFTVRFTVKTIRLGQ